MQGVMGIIILFIGVVITALIGTQILGNVSINCDGLSGYDSDDPTSSTGWAKQCLDTQESAIESYGLLMVMLIVLAAVGILLVIRMFGGAG